MNSVKDSNDKEDIYNIAGAVRTFTRAQVRAIQVYQALVPQH